MLIGFKAFQNSLTNFMTNIAVVQFKHFKIENMVNPGEKPMLLLRKVDVSFLNAVYLLTIQGPII